MIFRILCMIILFTSCNENFSGGARWLPAPQEEVQLSPPPEDFTTRLSPTLLVAGKKCRGDETTEPGGHGRRCDPGQYLIYLDNINTCDSNGLCTDLVVTPIIGELFDTRAQTDDGTKVFEIIPQTVITEDQTAIIKGVAISTDVNGNGTVFFKFGPIANI